MGPPTAAPTNAGLLEQPRLARSLVVPRLTDASARRYQISPVF